MEFPLTIENQEEFDKHISKRLSRVRQEVERGAKAELGVEELRTQLSEAEERAENAVQTAHQRLVKRDVVTLLSGMNVEGSRQERVLKLLDLEGIPTDGVSPGDPDQKTIERRVKALYKDAPELFGADATVEQHGLDTSAGERDQGHLDRESLETMTPEEINANWSTIKERLPAWWGGGR